MLPEVRQGLEYCRRCASTLDAPKKKAVKAFWYSDLASFSSWVMPWRALLRSVQRLRNPVQSCWMTLVPQESPENLSGSSSSLWMWLCWTRAHSFESLPNNKCFQPMWLWESTTNYSSASREAFAKSQASPAVSAQKAQRRRSLRPGWVFSLSRRVERNWACRVRHDWRAGHDIQCQSSSVGASQEGQLAGIVDFCWRSQNPIGRIVCTW